MTKKSVLGISVVGVVWWLILFILNSILFSIGGKCHMYYLGWCGSISNIIEHTIAWVPPFVSLFLLSLITYKMRDEVFQTWIKFAYIWLPLTILLTFLSPEYSSSLLPITKGVVSFGMSLLFLIVSLVIILITYLSSKSNK